MTPSGRSRHAARGRAPARRRERDLLAAIEACYACRELDAWPSIALGALRSLIDCDLAGFNDLDPESGRYVALLEPDRKMPEGWAETWARFGTQNPAYNRLVAEGDVGPYRLSDYLRQRELRATELYRRLYRELGVHYQIAAALEGPKPQVTAFALTRERRDFTNADVELLGLIRPHLRRAYDTARALSGLERDRARLAEASRTAGVRLLSLTAKGDVLDATEPALSLLARYLAPVMVGEALPQPLRSWALRVLPNKRPAATTLPTPAGPLGLRLVPGGEASLLLLDEPVPAELGAAALTAREREVVEAIRTGATNAAAAAALGMSERTIEKHLEHVFAKLGVPNRLAAVSLYERLLRASTY
jgi:DNA-binding CsgD family transcriptional regulator